MDSEVSLSFNFFLYYVRHFGHFNRSFLLTTDLLNLRGSESNLLISGRLSSVRLSPSVAKVRPIQ